MTPPAQFTYKGHRVEIVPPDVQRLIGNYWQLKIDGVLKRDLLFSSARVAAQRAAELIDTERERETRIERRGKLLPHTQVFGGVGAAMLAISDF